MTTGKTSANVATGASDALLEWLSNIAANRDPSRLVAAECASELQDFIITLGSADTSLSRVEKVCLHIRRLLHRRLASPHHHPPVRRSAQARGSNTTSITATDAIPAAPAAHGYATGEVRARLLSVSSPFSAAPPTPAAIDSLLAALTLATGDVLLASLLGKHTHVHSTAGMGSGEGTAAGVWVGPSWVTLSGQGQGQPTGVLAVRIARKIKGKDEVSLDQLVAYLHALGLPLDHALWDVCARLALGWALAGTGQRGGESRPAEVKLGRADELLRVAFDAIPATLQRRLQPCLHHLLPLASLAGPSCSSSSSSSTKSAKEGRKGSIMQAQHASPPWLILSLTPEAGTGGQTMHVSVTLRGAGEGEGQAVQLSEGAGDERGARTRTSRGQTADAVAGMDDQGKQDAVQSLPQPPAAVPPPNHSAPVTVLPHSAGPIVMPVSDPAPHTPLELVPVQPREHSRTAAQALLHAMRDSPHTEGLEPPSATPLPTSGGATGAWHGEGREGREEHGALPSLGSSTTAAAASQHGTAAGDVKLMSMAELLQAVSTRGPSDPAFLLHLLQSIRRPLDLAWSSRGGGQGGPAGELSDREAALVAQRSSKRCHAGLLSALHELCARDEPHGVGAGAIKAAPTPLLAQLLGAAMDVLREEAYGGLHSSSSSSSAPRRFSAQAAPLYLRTLLVCADALAERGYEGKLRSKQQFCTRFLVRYSLALLAAREGCLDVQGGAEGDGEEEMRGLLTAACDHRLFTAAAQALPSLPVLVQGSWSPREAVEVGRALSLYLHARTAVSCPPQLGKPVFLPSRPILPVHVVGKLLMDGGGTQAHAVLHTGQAHASTPFWLQPASHGSLLSIGRGIGVGEVELERVKKALRDVAMRVCRLRGGGGGGGGGGGPGADASSPASAPHAAEEEKGRDRAGHGGGEGEGGLSGKAKIAWDSRYPTLPGQEALLLAEDMWALGVPLTDTVWAGLAVNAAATHTWGASEGTGAGGARRGGRAPRATWPCIRPDTRDDKAALAVLKDFAAWHKAWRKRGRAAALATRAQAHALHAQGGEAEAEEEEEEEAPPVDEEQDNCADSRQGRTQE